jgi:hypothetical protein
MTENPNIDWNYAGKPDALMGTGATRAEKIIAYLAGLIVPIALIVQGMRGVLVWTWWQWVIAILIGMDISSGAVANALNSCKRFYHSPTKPEEAGYRLLKNPILFTAIHIYPFIVWILFEESSWLYGLVWYTILVFSSWVLTRLSLYLQRPVAVFIILLVIVVNLYVIQPIAGFEWLAPLLFIKLILGHGVREEPYRPT